jgi:predicted phosphodiesterase
MATVKFAAVSCTHAPLQDDYAVTWALNEIEEFKPDVLVHLGDLLEASAASKFPKEDDWSLEDEYTQGNVLLSQFAKAAGKKARKVFLPGNHDFNIRSYARLPKDVRSLLDYRKHMPALAEWEQPVDEYVYDRNRGVFRIGQVTFAHGFAAGVQADKQHALDLGLPYGLYIGGHSHQPRPVEQVRANQTTPLPYWMSNVGTLRDIWTTADTWMRRKRRHLWGQAMIVGEVNDTWESHTQGLVPSAPEWDAEVKVFRMYNQRSDV